MLTNGSNVISEEYLATEIKSSRSARNNPRLVIEESRPIA